MKQQNNISEKSKISIRNLNCRAYMNESALNDKYIKTTLIYLVSAEMISMGDCRSPRWHTSPEQMGWV